MRAIWKGSISFGLYKDEYREVLLELIQKKIESGGRTPATGKAAGKRTSTKVIDLVSVLQQSLEKTGKRMTTEKAARPASSKHIVKKAA